MRAGANSPSQGFPADAPFTGPIIFQAAESSTTADDDATHPSATSARRVMVTITDASASYGSTRRRTTEG
ncbi:hypothetical protein BHE74_00046260 [Ensete ventricosum]|nr:hypothetical protein BHE74_00046260 [Ensete ventricosum]